MIFGVVCFRSTVEQSLNTSLMSLERSSEILREMDFRGMPQECWMCLDVLGCASFALKHVGYGHVTKVSDNA